MFFGTATCDFNSAILWQLLKSCPQQTPTSNIVAPNGMKFFLPWPTLACMAKALKSPKDHLAFPHWWFCGLWLVWLARLAGMHGCEAWCPAKSHNVHGLTIGTKVLSTHRLENQAHTHT